MVRRCEELHFRIAEISFVALLGFFALLAWGKIRKSDSTPAENPAITPPDTPPPAPTPPVRPPARPKPEDEGKSKIESPLSLLFSALVLLWALLVICYRQQESVPAKPPPPSISSEILLPPVSGFVAGNSTDLDNKRSLERVTQDTIRNYQGVIKPDDLLLLLGSADCTAVRKSPGKPTVPLRGNERRTWPPSSEA